VLEDEPRAAIPEEVFEEQVGLMVDVLDVGEISAAVKEMREQSPGS
jgi:tetrahydromethanopterin S-methyltransferase subunit A